MPVLPEEGRTGAASADLDVTGVSRSQAASSRMRLNVDTFEWPAVALAATEADFDIIEPEELRAYLRAAARRFAGCCAPPSGEGAIERPDPHR